MVRTLGKTIYLTWYALQGSLLAILSLCGLLFLAGRVGFVEPYSAYVILSGSMSPAIPVGSVIISQKQLSYSVGDIITFSQGKSSVTHRVSEIEDSPIFYGDQTFITKGDANKTVDTSPVSQSVVSGKTLYTIPYLGYVIEYAKSPKGFLAMVIIPATIIIYEELKNVRKELGKVLFKIVSRFKKREQDIDAPQPAKFPTAIAVPVIAAAFLFTATAGAYFLDAETSSANVLGAATSFGEQVATLYESDPFTCSDGATSTIDDFGVVVMKTIDTTLSIDVSLSGATPNSSYDLWVNQDPNGCPLSSPTVPGGLVTDSSGNGAVHLDTPLVSSATKFWISAVGEGQVLRSVAVSL